MLGGRGLRRVEGGSAGVCAQAEIPTECPVRGPYAGAAGLRDRRGAGLWRGKRENLAAPLVRDQGIFPLAGKEHVQDARAGLSLALPHLQSLPGCGGSAAPARGPLLEVAGPTLPDLYQMPVARSCSLSWPERPAAVRAPRPAAWHSTPSSTGCAISTRSDWATSRSTAPRARFRGGEVERVNLTSCLGTSLSTRCLFSMSRASGLHSRDVGSADPDHPLADRRRATPSSWSSTTRR